MIQKTVLVALVALLYSTAVEATVRTSRATGNWNSTSVWNGGTIPQANDTVIVNAGHIVTVNGNYPSTSTSFRGLTLYGTLSYTNGVKINIIESGFFEIMAGGLLIGGNGGSRIQFVTNSNTTVYEIPGPFNMTGPMFATGGTGGFVGGALPVAWLSMEAIATGSQVNVDWSTASESQSLHFEVEMSTNGTDWATQGTVAAAGNSIDIRNYHLNITGVSAGVKYFRIKQVDLNGMFEYSDIFSANVQAVVVEVNAYPNPTSGVLNVNTNASGEVKAVVRNAYGQIVAEQTSAAGNFKVDFTGFQSGVYHVQVLANGLVIEKKIVKQ